MESLTSSLLEASVPYGNWFEAETLLSSETFSDSSLPTNLSGFQELWCYTYRSKENTRAILPTAIILFLIICLRSSCGGKDAETRVSSSLSSSSSLVQVLRTATSMSVTIWRQRFSYTKGKGVLFSPTNGKLHVKTSMKLGNQYGWGVQLNCLIFIMLLSYFKTAALLL